MSGKRILLPLPTDNPVGSTSTAEGTPGHPEDHDRIREILAVLVDGFVPGVLNDLGDVNTDNVDDGVGTGFALLWDGGKFTPTQLPVPVVSALVSGATLRLQAADGTYSDVLLPVNTGPAGAPGAAGRGISALTTSDVGADRHLLVTYTDDPNNPVDLGLLPRGASGVSGTDGRDGISATSFAVNAAGRLIVTLSDGTSIDAGNVVGPAGVGSFADSFRGEWASGTTYAKNDIVSYMGDSYFSRIDSNTGTPPAENATSAQWALLALNGAKGDMGAQGNVGPTPNLTVGTVSTLDPGTTATASLTGTPLAPVLNLGLPRGGTGDPGARGADGAQGVPGTPGAAGRGISAVTLSATNVLTVTYTDTTASTVGTIATVKGDTGPAGAPGAAGATGSPGAAAQLAIGTVSTVAAGGQATAGVRGTAPNYLLDLGLPAGVAGAAGATGAAGPAGRGVTSLALASGNVLSVTYSDSATPVTVGTISPLLPAATAVGQVLTATSTAAGGYAFATAPGQTGLHRGAWSQAATYVLGDVVGFGGNTYRASAAVPAGQADTFTSGASGTGYRNALTSSLSGVVIVTGSPSQDASGLRFGNGATGQGLGYVLDSGVTSPAGLTFSITQLTTTNRDFQYLTVGARLTNSGNLDNGTTGSTNGDYLQLMHDTGGWQLRRCTAGATSGFTTLASGTFPVAPGKGTAVAFTFAFDNTGALTLSASVAGATATLLTTQPGSVVAGMSFGTGGIAFGFGQSYQDQNNNGVPYRSALQVFGGTALPATVDPLQVLAPPAAYFSVVGGLPTPAGAGRVLKSSGAYPGAFGWVTSTDVPTPTAAGQVLTATGALAGAFAFAAPATPPGTFKGVWSTTATYAVGDVVSYQGLLYQASAASANQATFPTASFTQVTSAAQQVRGAWSATGTYAVGDVVIYLNSYYQASAASTNQATFPTASFTRLTFGVPVASRAGLALQSAGTDASSQWAPAAAALAGAWTAIPLASGITANADSIPQYRVIGDRVEIRGYFRNVNAGTQAQVTMGTLPAAYAPTSEQIQVGFFGNTVGPAPINIKTTGAIQVYPASTASAAVIGVYGMSWSITADNSQPAYSSTFLTTQPTAWTTLAPTAGTQGSPSPFQYRLNGDRVELRGTIGGLTTSTSLTPFTMPVGARPPSEVVVPVLAYSTGKPCLIVIASTGVATLYLGQGATSLSNDSVAFNGIDYSVSTTTTLAPTGAVGSSWTALPLASGSAGTSAPQYRIVGEEVQLRGFVSGVTVGANAVLTIATLPTGFRPSSEQAFAALNVAAGGLTGLGVKADGSVYVYGPTALSSATVAIAPVRFSVTA